MKPSEVRVVSVDKIDINPYRNLHAYPTVRSKVEALKNSISINGVWPSIIARPSANGRVQQAFGTHRIAAAKEVGLKEVPIIMLELNDQQMLQYMAAENGEDYSTNFQIMLNTWEAGVTFNTRRNLTQAVDVARLLGWTRTDSSGYDKMNHLARACAGATALIQAGHLERSDLADLSVNVARDIVERALSRMESIDRQGKLAGAQAKDIVRAKSFVSKGVKATAGEVREGKIAKSQIRSSVDMNTLRAADRNKEKAPLLFVAFGYKLAESINRTLASDNDAEKLAEIVKVLDYVIDESDKTILRQIDFELGELSVRATTWRKRLAADKVKPFPATAQIGGPS